jgi:hypothetical protein
MADNVSTDTRTPSTPLPLGEPVELAGVVNPVEPKAGIRTTELWLKVLADGLTVAYASGWIPTGGIVATIVAIIATQLTALGYAVIRAQVKGTLTRSLAAMSAGSTVASLLVAGAILAACALGSTVRKDASIGVVAAASCEVGGLSAQDAHDAGVYAQRQVDSWISGTRPGDVAAAKAQIAADLKPLEGQLLPCLIAGIIAAIAGPPNPSSGSTSQALADAAPDAAHTVALAFKLAAREAGWPRISTPGGAQ